jgi:hypothetical protein
MEYRSLSEVQVLASYKAGRNGIAAKSFAVGSEGVTSIETLPDLRVVICVGDRVLQVFWPENVVGGVPLRAEPCPVQREAAEASSESLAESLVSADRDTPAALSEVAQPAEQVAVNYPRGGSIPSLGAVDAEAQTERAPKPLARKQRGRKR